MRRQRLRLGNFSKGMLRDSATDEDRLLSLRTLKNYFIDYSDGRLKVRNGYSRWNDTQLAAPATQLFSFVDLSQNEHLLGIVDGTWDEIKETGSHSEVHSDAATARRPIVQVGNRAMFATDAEAYWTDDSALGGATKSFRLGIEKPPNGPGVAGATGEGNTATSSEPNKAAVATGGGLRLTDSSGPADGNHLKIAATYTPSADVEVQQIAIKLMPVFVAPNFGAFRMSIYTGVAEPTTLVTNALSDWIDMTQFTADSYSWQFIRLSEKVTLSSGVRHWIVCEPDTNYTNNFHTSTFYLAFSHSTGVAVGNSLRWTGATWADEGNGRMQTFLLGGLDSTHTYDYKITYFNDTYKSESRPSVRSIRHTPSGPLSNRVTLTTTVSGDAQVDFVAIYRRDIGTDKTIAEESITADYEYIGKVVDGSNFSDGVAPGDELGKLTSDDHYLYDDVGEEGEAVRTSALVPAVMTFWKGRIWFVQANENILYFSKIQEEDGALGLTGDSLPDYFPLDNRLEISETSDIIALLPISADELAVYFRNKSIWVIRGSDDVLNPPADIVLRQIVTDVGLIAPAAVDSLRSRHVFVARKGVYTFCGTSTIEYLSGGIQTILDEIADSSLDDSVVVALGDSVWIAVDEDETADGKLNNIYILDIQRQPATWRVYNYGISINDMVVRKTGTEYKTLLAADADNNFILKLEDGNDDNGEAIIAEAETQDLIAPNLATIFEIQIDAYYPNAPPVYEGVVTDAKNETHSFEVAPTAIDDLAGHKSGLIVPSAIGSRVKIIQRTTNQNHLRAIDIGFVEQ